MLLVLPQVHFVLEAVVAERAAVGPVIPVFSAVGDEVGTLAECLATYLTHMRLFPWDTNRAHYTRCYKHSCNVLKVCNNWTGA